MASDDSRSALEAPTMTATEEAIAEMWRSLFGIAEVEAGDDFFALGGTSLTAIKFLSRVEAHFAEDVLLPETLYEDARLSSLAKAIDEAMA